ncbi:hypothetical protein BH09PAT2_BH09PAT2_05440 [soil metagenome]
MSAASIDELELFNKFGDSILESQLKNSLPKEKKYKNALIVGRFQPLHRGHIYLLHCALHLAETVTICIGSVNITDNDNPFSQKLRLELLKRSIKREQLEKYIDKIFTLDDIPDDDEWLAQALEKAGDIDVVIGNNDWVNGLFQKSGYSIVEVPLLKREEYQGKIIRDTLRSKGKL